MESVVLVCSGGFVGTGWRSQWLKCVVQLLAVTSCVIDNGLLTTW
jgi:hypothetical protein